MSTSLSFSRAALALALLPLLPYMMPARAQVFVDDFNDNYIDPDVWSVAPYGSGAQVAEQNQELEFFMPSSASGTEFGARSKSRYTRPLTPSTRIPSM